MELPRTLDEVARTSDDEVVRQRFDQRNLRALTALLVFFGIISLIELGSNPVRRGPFDVITAGTNLGLVLIVAFLLRDVFRLGGTRPGSWRIARWIRNHVTAFTLWYFTIQYLLLLAFNRRGDDWVAWAMIVPLLMMPLRMRAAELILLHAFFFGAATVMSFFSGVGQVWGPLIGSGIVNGIALSVELWSSRRMRRSLAGEWAERRAQAREQVRMRDELHYARELQLSMLPDCAPALDWLDICGTCVPATEVGGDYYDYFVEERRVAIVCGDVAGHGMASGLVLSAIRSGFTLLRDSLGDPAAVLRRLHDLVAQTSRRRMLVTVSVLLLEQSDRTATIASAGHPPLIRRRADGTTDTIELWAPPLGVRLPLAIPQMKIETAPGDVFVLHSDGIYETRNPDGEVYGLDRLQQVIGHAGGAGAEGTLNAILNDLTAFRGDSEQEDDVTVVVCRVV